MSFTCSQCSQKKKVEVNTFEDDVCLSCDCDIKHYTMAEFIAEFKLPTELNEDQKIIIDEITRHAIATFEAKNFLNTLFQ